MTEKLKTITFKVPDDVYDIFLDHWGGSGATKVSSFLEDYGQDYIDDEDRFSYDLVMDHLKPDEIVTVGVQMPADFVDRLTAIAASKDETVSMVCACLMHRWVEKMREMMLEAYDHDEADDEPVEAVERKDPGPWGLRTVLRKGLQQRPAGVEEVWPARGNTKKDSQIAKARRWLGCHPDSYVSMTLTYDGEPVEVLYSYTPDDPVEAPAQTVQADPEPDSSSPSPDAVETSERVSAAAEERPWPRLRVRMSKDEFVECLDAVGLDQAGAARVLDLSERTIRRYCRGGLPIPRTVAIVVRLLGHVDI